MTYYLAVLLILAAVGSYFMLAMWAAFFGFKPWPFHRSSGNGLTDAK